jgi:hypothetical protein
MPYPAKSIVMVTLDRWSLSSGSTVTSTAARIGPSIPRTPQRWGGSTLGDFGCHNPIGEPDPPGGRALVAD